MLVLSPIEIERQRTEFGKKQGASSFHTFLPNVGSLWRFVFRLNIKQTDAITDVRPRGAWISGGAWHFTPHSVCGGADSLVTPYLDPDNPICRDPVESGSAA